MKLENVNDFCVPGITYERVQHSIHYIKVHEPLDYGHRVWKKKKFSANQN